jgi:selenocysteine lyase/cysteine desulfurase
VYAPHIGILFARNELLRTIDFPKLRPAPDNAPDRAETGTQSHESIVGAAAAVDFIASLGAGATRREKLENAFARMHERDIELTRELWNGLAEIPGVRLYGPKYDALRTSLVSFTVSDVPSEEVSRYLAERGMFVSHGNFYAATVAEKLGVADQGLVRIGCSIYTTLEEVRRLVEGVKEFVSERS